MKTINNYISSVRQWLRFSSRGFSLLEVLIALTIFSVFAAVFVTSQGYNLANSELLREELLLRELCANKLNDIITKPPEFRESLTLSFEVKTFEEYKDYEYKIQYKRFKIPNLNKIMGKEEDNSDSDDDGGLKTKVMENVIKNIEELVWQVEVTVKNKKTNFNYALTSWLFNHQAKVEFSGF